MSRLDKAISNVDPESLPGTDATPTTNAPDPGSAPGDQSGEGDGKEGGRTVDNVRGELVRKMEREREYFTGKISSLETKIDQLLSSGSSSAAAPKSQPNTLDDLSVSELKKLRPQVPDDQRESFDDYFEERRVREQVESQVKAITNRQSFAARERTANTEAMSRWPELRDATSELYKVTNRILNELGSAVDASPRAVLDAANEAGLQLGLSPKTGVKTRVRGVKRVASGQHNAPVDASDDLEPSADEVESLAASLSGGMKDRKFTKEQLARIAKKTGEYRRNQHLFVK